MGCNILLSFSHGQGMCVAQPSLECAQYVQHSLAQLRHGCTQLVGASKLLKAQWSPAQDQYTPLLKCEMPSDKCWRGTLDKGME